MQLGTIRLEDGIAAVRVEGDEAVRLPFAGVEEILSSGRLDLAGSLDELGRLPLDSVEWAPLVSQPNKIICVGLNYRDHVEEMGRDLPNAPTYFSKFSGSLIGANDELQLPDPSVSTHNDLEAELAIVIGTTARNVDAANAMGHVAGFTVFNDFSVRDYQTRTGQFLAGKTFERASGLGPVMVTVDEIGDGRGLGITSSVNGEVKQDSTTDQLVFGPNELIADLSRIITLVPGDIIATGTPGGVGAARTPPQWLLPDDELTISIDGIGELRHRCVIATT